MLMNAGGTGPFVMHARDVVDVHISRLRRKIDQPGEKPLIETLRGEGYRIGQTSS